MILYCAIIIRESNTRLALEKYLNDTFGLVLQGSFTETASAIDALFSKPVDLVFLGADMVEADRLAIINGMANQPIFILTNKDTTGITNSTPLNMLDFSIKSIELIRFFKLRATHNDMFIFRDKSTIFLRHNEIHYIKGNGEYVTIATARKKYVVLKTMIGMEQELPKNKFIRVQKSYIVNLDFVEGVSPNSVIMKEDINDIPIGLTYRASLYKRLQIDLKM